MTASINETTPMDSRRRRQLTLAVLSLFDKWHVADEQRLQMLGESADNTALLQTLAEGGSLEADSEALQRAGHLLGIHRSLQQRYANSPRIVEEWIHCPNSLTNNQAPIEWLCLKNIDGVQRVHKLVEAQFGGGWS
ncbi:hypothetical protein J2T55_002114 [Methylohalomonas lacus]|uniref:Antitoxin Xre/MbcA/ParS-like toxin-binding domain-containing protein n=1 Tax=Methylohalomonas lacus TaxID=398773 RepID=A0AAE3HMU0_9GAMM|nr:hypothetical protein [Methylohalomonas lacus]MCS3904081.1 hypothetical protein [Methylohalomonas lacus]